VIALVMINIVLSLTGGCFHNPSGKGRIPPRIGYTALVITVDQKEYIPPSPSTQYGRAGRGECCFNGRIQKTSSLETLQAKWTSLGIPK